MFKVRMEKFLIKVQVAYVLYEHEKYHLHFCFKSIEKIETKTI